MGLNVLPDIKGFNEKTVLVATPGCSSVKFMGGLSVTKHIVSEQWLHKCNDSNLLVPTSQYIINYADASIRNGECLRASGAYLLSGMCVHLVMGTNRKRFNMPSIEELRDLVEVSGGEWVSTQRKAGNSNAAKLLILMDERAEPTQCIQTLLEKGATKIRWCDLKNCLLAQSLEPILGARKTTQKPKTKSRAQMFKATLGNLITSPQMKRSPTKSHENLSDVEAAEEEVEVTSSTQAVPNTPRDDTQEASHSPILDQQVLVYNTELKFLHRNLSNAGGNQNRGQLGPGVMHIMKSSNTGLLTVLVFNKDGKQFQSEVPQDLSGFFGNAGRENIVGWDAYDTSGNIVSINDATKESKTNKKNGAHLRRFYFHFESREQLTCVLFVLFGSDDNARKLTEEFFVETGRFCPKEEPELPHQVFDQNSMDIDDINGSTPVRPSAPTSRVPFDNDPQAPSQVY